MEKKKEKEMKGLQEEEIQVLRTGFSNNSNLLSEDQLSEIYGGYTPNCTQVYCTAYKYDPDDFPFK